MINKKISYNNLIGNIILILICCILFSGSSVLVSYIYPMILLLFLLVTLKNMVNHKIKIFSNLLHNRILFIIIIFLIIMIPFSIAQVETIKYILIFVILYCISVQFKDENKILKKMMSYILIFSVILAISIVLSQFIGNFCVKYFPFMLPKSLSSLEMYYNELKSGIYSGLCFERAYAATALTLGISVIYTRIIQNKKQSKLDLILLLLLFVALFSTGKRMHLLINVFNLFLVFFINVDKKNIKKGIKISIILFVLLIFILIKIPTAQKVFVRFFDENSNHTVETRQENFWVYCIEMFNNRPITGYGINSFTTYIIGKSDYKIYNAHNIYLQILAESGLVGFILFGSLFMVLLIRSIKILKKYKENNYAKQLINYSILLQFTFLIYGLSGNTLYYYSQLLFYFIAVIIINNVLLYKGEENEKNININIS